VLAAALAIYFLTVIPQSRALDEPSLRRPARLAICLILGQIALGVVNILALAPLPLQMAHLIVANILWVALVWIWLFLRTRRGSEFPTLKKPGVN
jgi:heme A synthase